MIKKALLKAWKPLLWEMIVFFILTTMDSMNLPSKFGIDISKINLGILGITVDVLIAVTVFIITYFLIQEREIEKQDNQRRIARHLVRTSMKLCETYIYELDRPGISEMMLRVNQNENEEIKDKSAFFSKYEDVPFEYDSTIAQFIVNGILSDKEMERYEKAKNSYKAYVYAYKIYGNNKNRDEQKLMYDMKQMALEAICKAK